MSDNSGDHVQPDGPYGYLPNFAICITFIVLFGLSSLLHAIQAIWTRHWFFLYTALLCGLLETLGWAARFWSNQNLFNGQAFTIQISTLIIAPTFLLAAVFMIFGDLVKVLGVQYSRLGPLLYARIFFTCDIISLALQGIGGGMASAAADNNGNIQPTLIKKLLIKGTNLMLVGIALQLVIIVAFMLLAGEFLYRYRNDRPLSRFLSNSSGSASTLNEHARGELGGKRRFVLCAVVLSTTCLFARGIYRMIELSDGWNGKVMHTEWLFAFLDTGLVLAAMYVWNFAHPGWFLHPNPEKKDLEMRGSASIQ
ncbi:RTA1 like protein [Dendrothele bispora CBS 962.96]|uniref:RTA1 like protein n=1 Tax=Dendrothele bispora (strain CBS 962.96) TaxID=1314807 RepID=A0A4S8LRV4_DENBC|nr:RTA1 like protein [Dendrothele bispora CBS 962.96]